MVTRIITSFLATMIAGTILGALLGITTPFPDEPGLPALFAMVFACLGAVFGLTEALVLLALNKLGWCKSLAESALAGGLWLMFAFVLLALVWHDSVDFLDVLKILLGGALMGIVYRLSANVLSINRLKLFGKNFLGAAIGTLIYQLITQSLVGGFHLHATMIGMFVLGAVFAIVNSSAVCYFRSSSFVTCVFSGLVSSAIVGAAIVAIVGPQHLIESLSSSPFEALSGLFGLAALPGAGGYLAMRMFGK